MRFLALLKKEVLLFWIHGSVHIAVISLLSASTYFFQRYLSSFTVQLEQYQAGFLGELGMPIIEDLVFRPYFETIHFLLLFIIPVLGTFLFAEDRKEGFLFYLFTLPLTNLEIVIAKYLAMMWNLFLFILAALVPVSILLVELDLSFRSVVFGLMGLSLATLFYVAIGVWLSQYVRSSLALAVVHFAVLMTLFFFSSLTRDSLFGLGTFLRACSPTLYTTEIFEGFLSLQQVFFFVVGAAICLICGMRELSRERFGSNRQGKAA